jgi:hypothetical protein
MLSDSVIGSITRVIGRSCPGEWCNSGEAIVIFGGAGSIKLLPLRAA